MPYKSTSMKATVKAIHIEKNFETNMLSSILAEPHTRPSFTMQIQFESLNS